MLVFAPILLSVFYFGVIFSRFSQNKAFCDFLLASTFLFIQGAGGLRGHTSRFSRWAPVWARPFSLGAGGLQVLSRLEQIDVRNDTLQCASSKVEKRRLCRIPLCSVVCGTVLPRLYFFPRSDLPVVMIIHFWLGRCKCGARPTTPLFRIGSALEGRALRR